MQITGIYRITSPSGKIYIGQSTNIYKRWAGYKRSLSKNQPILHNSFSKYGVDNHKFEIQNICTNNKDLLDKLEEFWIRYYNSANNLVGLNIRNGGGSHGLLSEDTKKKIGESRKGKYGGVDNPFYGKTHSKETIDKVIESNKKRLGVYNTVKSKPIIQLDLNNNFITEFASAREVQRVLGFAPSNIGATCSGKYETHYGFKWKFKKDYNNA